LYILSAVATGGCLHMKRKFPDLVCAKCGSNRFKFPKSADDEVKCEDCGHPVATLNELQAKIVGEPKRQESRSERLKRHAEEVAKSHEELRASVAQTDRLIVSSNEMIRRHREEDEEAGD
jgi:ribosomal protein S27E